MKKFTTACSIMRVSQLPATVFVDESIKLPSRSDGITLWDYFVYYAQYILTLFADQKFGYYKIILKSLCIGEF